MDLPRFCTGPPWFCTGPATDGPYGWMVRYLFVLADDEHSRASDLFGLNRFVEIGEEVSATLMLSSRGFNRCLKIDARTIGFVRCCHRSSSFDRLSSAKVES
uniref:Uncharacterized protein n=1 Tax=Solanum lycopersicum TaxID=4081 RepID=A0A3Q7G7D8_SOLLC